MTDLQGSSVRVRVLNGVGSSALGNIISLVQSILLVPLFIEAWGVDLYGRWLVITAAIIYLGHLDLGMQNYIANLLAIAHARKDEEAFAERMSEGVSLFLLVCLVMSFILLIFLVSFMGNEVPGLGRSLEIWEAIVIGFLGLAYLIAVPSGIFASGYRATGLFFRGQMIGNSLKLLGLIGSILVLYLALQPTVFSFWMLISGIIGLLVPVFDLPKRVPALKKIKINLKRAKNGKVHLAGSIRFWLMSVMNVVKFQGVLLIVASLVSPVRVALFVTHKTLTNIAGYLFQLVQGPVTPELSFLWAQKRFSDFVRMQGLFVKAVVFFSGLVAIFLWLFAPLVYSLWTGGELELDPDLLLVFLGQAVLVVCGNTISLGMIATNHHKQLSMWMVLNAMLTLGLSWLWVESYGIHGIAMAGLVADFITAILVFPFLVADFLSVNLRNIYIDIASPLFFLFPFLGLAYFSGTLFDGWMVLGFWSLMGTVIVFPFSRWLLGAEDVDKVLSYVLKAIELRRENH